MLRREHRYLLRLDGKIPPHLQCINEHMQLTQGQYGFTAVETIPGQETLLRYGDVAATTLTGRMILHLCSAQGCRAEVLVNGSEATVIRDRETFDDMISHTHVPERLKK